METAWKIIEFVKKKFHVVEFGIILLWFTETVWARKHKVNSSNTVSVWHTLCAMCLHTIQILPWSEARSSTEQTQWTFDISSHSPDLFSRFFGGFATLFRDAPSLIFAAASTTFASMLARVARCAIFAGFSVDFAGTLARLASLADFFCCWSCCIAQQPFC